ncbi:MAG TPA: energy transducer TonB [Acidobacteriaceae bacterium]|nr:energy transducer TonB [Acidobacteriaceae bacterium]
MRSRACLLLSLLLSSPFVFTQESPAHPQPDAQTPVPNQDGAYPLGPGVEAPYLTSPAMATAPDGANLSRPRIVHFSAVIAADGSLTQLTVLERQGDGFEAAAMAALQQSKFAPGRIDGKPVPVAVCLRVPFIHVQPAIPRLGPCPRRGAGLGEDFRMPSGVTPPRPTQAGTPEYSDEARKKHIEGMVMLSTLVDEQGMPTDIRVERGIGYGLDENAVRSVSQYRFRPATDRDGRPVAVRIAIEVSFRLYH